MATNPRDPNALRALKRTPASAPVVGEAPTPAPKVAPQPKAPKVSPATTPKAAPAATAPAATPKAPKATPPASKPQPVDRVATERARAELAARREQQERRRIAARGQRRAMYHQFQAELVKVAQALGGPVTLVFSPNGLVEVWQGDQVLHADGVFSGVRALVRSRETSE